MFDFNFGLALFTFGLLFVWVISFIILIVLKLTGTIDWSWYWTTSVIWIPIGFVLILHLIELICENFKKILRFITTPFRYLWNIFKAFKERRF